LEAEVQVAAGSDLSTLRSLASSLPKGEQTILCVPDDIWADALLSPIGKWRSASGLPKAVFEASSQAVALSLVRKALSSHPARFLLVVDVPSPLKERVILDLHGRITPLLKKRGISSLWIVRRPSFSDIGLGGFKDLPRFFFDCTPSGSSLYSQCVTARGIYSPGFFSPRRIEFDDPDLRLDQPAFAGFAPRNAKERGVGSSPPGGVDPLQETYREIFRLSPEAIILFDLNGPGRDPNPKACELLGYQGQELEAVPLSGLVAARSYRSALRAVASLRRKRRISGEMELLRKNGREFSISFSAAPLGSSRGVIILRDISVELRRVEEARVENERLSALAEASPIPQVMFCGRRLVHANAAFRKTFSWVDASSGEVTLREFLGKENASLARELSATEPADGDLSGVARDQITLTAPEGERRAYTLSASRTLWMGKGSWYLTLSDVTARNAALQSLRESEGSYREMCEKEGGPLSVVRDGTFMFANGACAALFGVGSPADLVGKEFPALVAPRDRKTVAAAVAPDSKERAALVYTIRSSDGSLKTVEALCTSIHFAGTPALLIYHRDITEIRRAEEELRRQSRGEAILENLAHRIHLSLSPADVLSEGLQGAMKWLGFESGGAYRTDRDGTTLLLCADESLNPRIATALARQDAREGVTGMVWKTAEPLLLDMNDYPPHIPYKSLFESEGLRSVLYLPLIAGDVVVGTLLLCSSKEAGSPAADTVLCSAIGRHTGDALANALRYEQISASELMYRNAVELLTDVVYECAPNGQFVYLSPRVEQLTGYLPEEIIRSPDIWRTLLHPDERGEYSRRISNQGEGKDEFDLEYRILPKGKASYRWVRDSVRYERDKAGKVTGIHGVVSDITSRIEKARVTAAGEGTHDDLLESVQEGVVVYDTDLRYREWNKGMELITGIKREDVIGRNAFVDGPRFELVDFPDLLNRALAGTPVSSEEVRYARSGSEETAVLWCRFSPLRDRGGNIGGVVGTVTDVTHRKSLERELRESEETLRNVIDTMGDALMISDLQGKVWEVNREFSLLTGYSRGEVIGLVFPYPWLIEEEMSRLVVWLAALREKRFLRDFDMRWKKHGGTEVAISLNTSLLRNALGEPVAMLNIARDISERKGLADDLAAKSRQIEMLNRIISTANSSTDFIRIFDVIAAEVRTLTPFDHMSVCLLAEGGENLVVHATVGAEDRFPPVGASVPLQGCVSRLSVAEGRGLVIGDIATHPSLGGDLLSARAGMRSEINIPILLNERVLGTFDVSSAEPDAFGLGELTYLQPIADQIGALIDRTMLFQRVSLDSAYIHDLLDSIESVVYTVDRNSIVREVNKAWREHAVLQGTPDLREESAVIGKRLEEIIPFSPLREELIAAAARLFEGSMREYLHEFSIGSGEKARIFQLAVTPLEMDERVNGLVFTYTDITDSKRTEAEIKRRNEELLALNAIASSINRSLNPDEVLGVAAEQVGSLVQADIVLCYLPDESLERITLAAHRGIGEDHARLVASLPVSGSATGSVIRERKPIIIPSGLPDDVRLSEPGRALFRELGTESLLGIPLESKDRILGALVVAFQNEHTFNEQEQRFIRLVGNQLASALENAQLYSEVQAQVRRVTLLYEIGRGLTGALDIRSVLTVVHDGLKNVLEFDSFAYFSRSPKTGQLVLQFSRDRENSGNVPLSPDMPGVLAALSGEPFSGNSPAGGSLLAVPVSSKGETAGVIALGREATGLFAEAHLRLVASIANLMSIAIDRAGLYEDTVTKSQEIAARNKELDDFTYVVSHDLKEPLITIDGYSKIVLNDYRDVIDEEGMGYLTSIVQSGKRMKGLIDDLLTLSRLGRVSETEESLPLRDVIGEVLHDIEFSLRESHAIVSVPDELPTVSYNRIQLGMVFRNLIANAIKFNRSSAPRVDIAVIRAEGGYTISVQDNGIGIERQQYDKIFVIFQRLHRTEDFRGTGAGLTIVKKIVENHGGRIWLDSVVGEGTKFYFTIPD
jgi:PAS domain S-box-containing protein